MIPEMFLQRAFYVILLFSILFSIHFVITPQLADVIKRSLHVAKTTTTTTPTAFKPATTFPFHPSSRLESRIPDVKEKNLSHREQRENVPVKPTCMAHQNVAFIKVHKCGSSTTQAIFIRYGLEHDLVVALPRQTASPWIGCGKTILPQQTIKLPQGTKWNIFAFHSTYNRVNFQHFMPKDTRFVAILRNPFSRIKSAFNYFHLEQYIPGLVEKGRSFDSPIVTYLKNPIYWDGVFKAPKKCFQDVCVKNCMAKDLGLEEDNVNSRMAIRQFIKSIEKDFTLVMILEYFNHSLVLLKRRLCWTLRDILYNSRKYKSKKYDYKGSNSTAITDKMETNYKRSSAIDHALYAHFNQSLWSQIQEEGDGFLEEVRHFETVLAKVWKRCAAGKNKTSRLRIKASAWNDELVVDRRFCSNLGKPRWQLELDIRDKLTRRFYNKIPAKAGRV